VVKGWHLHREITLNYACIYGRTKLVIPVTVRRLMEAVGELMGGTALIEFGNLAPTAEPSHVWGANGRLAQATGWSPRYSIREGLGQTIQWWAGEAAQARRLT
jgi:nucleoside-diphosphate-sugar epimerase